MPVKTGKRGTIQQQKLISLLRARAAVGMRKQGMSWKLIGRQLRMDHSSLRRSVIRALGEAPLAEIEFFKGRRLNNRGCRVCGKEISRNAKFYCGNKCQRAYEVRTYRQAAE